AAEVFLGVFGPLVGLGQQQPIGIGGVEIRADLLQDFMGFRQVFIVGTFPFHQVGHGVQAQAVHAGVQPVAHHCQHFLQDLRIVVVEIRLMRIEAMPVIGLCGSIPRPVGLLGVAENDAGLAVALIIVGPNVVVAR